MSNRITVTNLRSMYAHYVKACEKAGFDTTGYQLVEGSKTYGRAYRSYKDGSGTPGADINGYLGTTVRETYEALDVAARTLWAVMDLHEGYRS
jgi:hypothetical protein